MVPGVAKRYGVDVLFNPLFLSVSIPRGSKKVMVMHNVEYHTIPNVYDWKMYARYREALIISAAGIGTLLPIVMTSDFRHRQIPD